MAFDLLTAAVDNVATASRRQECLLRHLQQHPLPEQQGAPAARGAYGDTSGGGGGGINAGPNTFKEALVAGKKQIGMWSGLGSSLSTDILSDSGYDWVLLDTEHSPNGPVQVFDQLMALDKPGGTRAVVRPPWVSHQTSTDRSTHHCIEIWK